MKRVLTVNIKSFTDHQKTPFYAFTLKEVAGIFDVSIYTIKRWIKAGKFNPIDLKSILDYYVIYTTDKK